MITEAIILAGGMGTRLQAVVNDVPKCLAPINGAPFLGYLLHYNHAQGINHFVLSVGYKADKIKDYISSLKLTFSISYCEETKPLGTGGAILQSLNYITTNNVIVLNGDSLFNYKMPELLHTHTTSQATCTVALKPMRNYNRYGSVSLTGSTVTQFHEKKQVAQGLINTGVYMVNTKKLKAIKLPPVCSFETAYLQENTSTNAIHGCVQDAYFLDIGIPEDYKQAQTDFKLFTHVS